jgi:hypothetical protein
MGFDILSMFMGFDIYQCLWVLIFYDGVYAATTGDLVK